MDVVTALIGRQQGYVRAMLGNGLQQSRMGRSRTPMAEVRSKAACREPSIPVWERRPFGDKNCNLAAAPLAVLLFFLAGGAVAQPALAQPKSARETSQPQQPQAAPRLAQIDRNGVLILVRSTLLALDQANKTGNYTVMRDLGAPGFQTNSAARLAEIFSKQRNEKLDLSGVAAIEPHSACCRRLKRTA